MASAGTSVGGVTVLPESFTLVDYDAGAIAEVAGRLWEKIGLPAELPLRIEVDETTPLGRAYVLAVEPAVELAVESGAFEHLHQPRQFDPERTADVLGRLLFRLHDRLDPAFGDPPPDTELPLPASTAWDVYAIGRLSRLGFVVQRPRRHYQFRVRHGFSDHVDAIFAQLWEAEGLDWTTLQALSDEAASAA